MRGGASACACIIRIPRTGTKLKVVGYLGSCSSSQAEIASALISFLALQTLRSRLSFRKPKVLFRSDNKIVLSAICSGIGHWSKNNWLNSDAVPLKDSAYWKMLEIVIAQFSIETEYVPGHTGDIDQEAADRACRWSKDKGLEFVEALGNGPIGRNKQTSPRYAWLHVDARCLIESALKGEITKESTRRLLANLRNVLTLNLNLQIRQPTITSRLKFWAA
jgi:ribonuclease HI